MSIFRTDKLVEKIDKVKLVLSNAALIRSFCLFEGFSHLFLSAA